MAGSSTGIVGLLTSEMVSKDPLGGSRLFRFGVRMASVRGALVSPPIPYGSGVLAAELEAEGSSSVGD